MRLSDLIGKTPLIRLRKIEEYFGLYSALYAKLEAFNPSGSVKDRAARFIIEDAFLGGKLRKGDTVIEATSGNMGISLSMLSAVYGYRAVIVMPENMSEERRAFIRGYGGELVLTDGERGMRGAIDRAATLTSQIKNSYSPLQFENRQGLIAHYKTTGPEIYSALDGKVDIFVSGVGTAATLMGVSHFLKEKSPSVRVVAVEPSESDVLSGGVASNHGIEGIGAGLVPPLFDAAMVDEVMLASTKEAKQMCRILGIREGIFAGISSGAALLCAISLGKKVENKEKNIVTIFPDGGEKYLSVSG